MKLVLYSYILFLSCIIVNGSDNSPYETSNGKCKDNEYLHHNLCCLSCPPGTHASKLCDSNTNTQCTPCGSDTYTSLSNHLPACLSCNGKCGSNQVETKSCDKTHNRICECSTGYYCLLKGSNGCKECTAQTKCEIGYGVSGYTPMGDTICSQCDIDTYSNTISSVDKCEPAPRNTFNYIDVEINMYPVNESSCTRITTTGISETILTSDLSININHTDCDPVFRNEYYAVLDNVLTSGLFTEEDKYQDASKTCNLNIEIKCNNEKDPSSKQLTKAENESTMPHSETVSLVGDCVSSIDIYIQYSNTNTHDYESNIVSYHVGNILDIDKHMPVSCGTHKLITKSRPAYFL
ncbi:TNF alpha receptor-like protein CrmB [Borealpox virus]|nr:TNF alpha receptor-like protein CrmB [Alaskapox virus]